MPADRTRCVGRGCFTRQIRGEPRTPKALCDAGAELADLLGFVLHGSPQDVTHLVLHAPRVPLRALLQLVRNVVLEVSNYEPVGR